MSVPRIGKLKPQYTLLLNPHADARLSRCPKCEKLTYPRKFAILIHVEGHGFYVQGKTCKYCSNCKTIMVQQDELEAQLALVASERFPEGLGQEYFIVGIVELNTFKQSLAGDAPAIDELLEHVSDLREQIGLSYTPGGWYRAGHEPPPLPEFRPQRIPPFPPAIGD
jgi:hypothetical protein